MPFQVVFLRGNDVVAFSTQGEIVSEAKAYALTHLPIQRARHQATAVEVRNEHGVTVFRYPDTI